MTRPAVLRDRDAHQCMVLLAIVGGVWRLADFLGNPVLHIDEAALARNLIGRSWSGLLHPLDFAQAAAPGVLWMQKALITLGGSGEYVLRLFSFIASCATLAVMIPIARLLLTPACAIGLIALMALSPTLIAFSVSAKPYAIDVAAASLALWLALLADEATDRRAALLYGASGIALALFSFSVMFVLVSAAGGLVLSSAQTPDRPHRGSRRIAAFGFALGGGFAVILSRLLTSQADLEYLRWFWVSGFAPWPLSGATGEWLARRLADLFGQTLHYRGATIWALTALLGALALVRERRDRAVLLAGPLLLVILAAAVRAYPFSPGRVALFLVPSVLILTLRGVMAVGGAGRVRRLGAAALFVALLGTGVHAAFRSDYAADIPRHDPRPFLAEAERTWTAGDRLFVYYGEAQPFLYYAPRVGLQPQDYVVGRCARGQWPVYAAELDALTAVPRVWLAMEGLDLDEERLFQQYISHLGGRETGRSAGILRGYGFRFEMPSGAAGASRPPFLVPPDLNLPAAHPWTCYGVFTPATVSRR